MAWRTIHPDHRGNCTIRLGDDLSEGSFKVLYPTDGSGRKTGGKFNCGRHTTAYEAQEIKFPANISCDDCTL